MIEEFDGSFLIFKSISYGKGLHLCLVIMSLGQSTTSSLRSIPESLFLNNALFTKQQNQKFKFELGGIQQLRGPNFDQF